MNLNFVFVIYVSFQLNIRYVVPYLLNGARISIK